MVVVDGMLNQTTLVAKCSRLIFTADQLRFAESGRQQSRVNEGEEKRKGAFYEEGWRKNAGRP